VCVNFLTVPLVLTFLNNTQYGIWLTLTAILTWFSLFDLGFGNGLRNKLITAIVNKNYAEGKIYVSTTYAALSVIFGALLILFLIVNQFINWTKIFNASPHLRSDLNQAVFYAISLLFVQFVLRLINTVLLSFQRSAMVDFINTLIQLAILAGLFIIKQMHFNSLSAVAFVYSIIPVIAFAIVNLILYLNKYNIVSPSIYYVKFTYVKSLLNLGLSFFIIQIAALVIYASDNFIISQLFTPADVTIYNIAYKYFSIGSICISIVLSPFWSMTTKAYVENDLNWIKKAIKKLTLVWAILVIITIIQLIFSNKLYDIWTRGKVVVPLSLSVMLCLYYIIVTLGTVFSNFLNGVGKIRLQVYFASVSMILNIPLAIFFVKVLHYGIIGIPLATIIVTTIVSVISYVQYYKITNLTATGVWNK
jgi:O-antigen/teichoic acid export membrane protein